MPNPAEDVPADCPAWWGDRGFYFGALRLGVPGTAGIGAMVKLADKFHRAFECMKVTIPVIADVHPASTDQTVAIKDVEFPQRKIRVFGPMVWHRANLHALM